MAFYIILKRVFCNSQTDCKSYFYRTVPITGALQHGWRITSITLSTHLHVCNILFIRCYHTNTVNTQNALNCHCLHTDYGEQQVKTALGIFLVCTL